MELVEYFDKLFEDELKRYREMSESKRELRIDISQFLKLQEKFGSFVKTLCSNLSLEWCEQKEIKEVVRSFPAGKKLFLVGSIPWDWGKVKKEDDYTILTDPLIYTLCSAFEGVKEQNLYFGLSGYEILLFGDRAEVYFSRGKERKIEINKYDMPYATLKQLAKRIAIFPDNTRGYEIIEELFGHSEYEDFGIFNMNKDVSCLIYCKSGGMLRVIKSSLKKLYPSAIEFRTI